MSSLTTPNGAVKAKKKSNIGSTILTVLFAIVCVVYILPIILVLINSFKSNSVINTDTFALPNGDSFVGLDNYVKGATFGNYPFIKSLGYSLVITLLSVFLILLCTSMTAWYISRVGSRFAKIFYFACVFSMIVPFQMVMFPLVSVATDLKLNTPWTIPIIYSASAQVCPYSCLRALSRACPSRSRRRRRSTAADRSVPSSWSSCRCSSRR